MDRIYIDYLYTQNILVGSEPKDEKSVEAFNVMYSLANIYAIKVTSGVKYLNEKVLKFIDEKIPFRAPSSFYLGFPESVRSLSGKQLVYDQLINYFRTYALNDFSTPVTSVFEETFDRKAFKGKGEIKRFTCVSEEEAALLIDKAVRNLALSTRELSSSNYELIKHYANINGINFTIAGRNTLIKLICDLKNSAYFSMLRLSEVIKVVEYVGNDYVFSSVFNKPAKKIRLKSANRRFVTKILDAIFYDVDNVDTTSCFEKQAVWCGLLHQLHYEPKNSIAKKFVQEIRSGKNNSAYSRFEKLMAQGKVYEAAVTLKNEKGSGTLLRNIDYILSRVPSGDKQNETVEKILELAETTNPIILYQLKNRYASQSKLNRTFVFTKNNLLKEHYETDDEFKKRRTFLSSKVTKKVQEFVDENLRKIFKNKFKKVYVDKGMKKIAMPISESTAQSGLGVLTKGSRVKIKNCDIIRAFTYWEKVNDIDLSCFGLSKSGDVEEFSWRNMAKKQGDAITFSGDMTSGYDGGSEYFDINIKAFKQKNPNCDYIVFCNNVYSGIPFSSVTCTAGYMERNEGDQGEIYEPKTIKTSFTVTPDSTYAIMFAIDLKAMEMIWINIAKDSYDIVAGDAKFDLLFKYFTLSKTCNVYDFFVNAATEVVSNYKDADIVVTDKQVKLNEKQELVRSYSVDKLLAYLNNF